MRTEQELIQEFEDNRHSHVWMSEVRAIVSQTIPPDWGLENHAEQNLASMWAREAMELVHWWTEYCERLKNPSKLFTILDRIGMGMQTHCLNCDRALPEHESFTCSRCSRKFCGACVYVPDIHTCRCHSCQSAVNSEEINRRLSRQ